MERNNLWHNEGDEMIPSGWLPNVPMKRIHFHWTAGNYNASSTDKKHYHILVEGMPEPRLVRGDPSIALNVPPVKPGYAAHTLNANGSSIAISLCGMRGAQESPFQAGPCPITKPQWELGIQAGAALAKVYKIPVTPQTILSHAEVGVNLNIPQRGKWDYTRLPFEPSLVGARACGDYMRKQITELLNSGLTIIAPSPTRDSDSNSRPLATVTAKVLNLREQPSVDSKILGQVDQGDKVEINKSTMNGDTEWLSVIVMDTRQWAWVAARYVMRD